MTWLQTTHGRQRRNLTLQAAGVPIDMVYDSHCQLRVAGLTSLGTCSHRANLPATAIAAHDTIHRACGSAHRSSPRPAQAPALGCW